MTTSAYTPNGLIYMTKELYHITKGISEGRSWSSILDSYCKAKDIPMLSGKDITVHYDVGDHGFEHEQFATWKGKYYKSNAYSTSYAANNNLYQKIVEGIIAKELEKTEKYLEKATAATLEVAEEGETDATKTIAAATVDQ